MNYNRINNITGWFVFVISLVTMTMTMAPTGPFWDCGEFLACMNELEVPHPPGAPLFMLLGRLFTMMAGSHPENVAWWGNFMSVVVSAFTVLFVFWTTTMLAKKLLANGEKEPIYSYNQTDFVKDKIAVEVQFGKYAFVAFDLFVKHMLFYSGGVINLGIEILPTKKMQSQMSSGVAYYEGEVYNVMRQGRNSPPVPLLILGIEP